MFLQDNIIEKLANDLRSVDNNSQVVTEAEQMLSKSESEEYNRPLTPITVPKQVGVLLSVALKE